MAKYSLGNFDTITPQETTLLLEISGVICFVVNLDNMKTHDEMLLCEFFKTS